MKTTVVMKKRYFGFIDCGIVYCVIYLVSIIIVAGNPLS